MAVRSSSTNFISSESSSSSDSGTIHNQKYRYDVFLSFRGPDTRNSFVDHLYSHLSRKGIFVFKDDQKLHKGESISSQLLQAIKDSRVSIIVFSQNYASSTWCLDEMAAVADFQQQSNQTVFPVFYDVDPSDVRYQNGVYENSFVLHTEKFKEDPDKVDRWKRAMNGFANSAGWDVRNKPEFEIIVEIVEEVIKTMGHKFSGFVDDLIGIQPGVQELEDKLRLRSNIDDVQVLGIWGMSGIGKTTHAAALYDKISHRFDGSCFIENVSKLHRDGGRTAVHKQIISQTFPGERLDTDDPVKISGIVKHRLHNMKVLVVLDSVVDSELLDDLAIKPELFFKGSRMVITTTDEHILKAYKAPVIIHKVSLLNDNDARTLFCTKAFKSEEQSSSCAEMIPEVLKYAQCLPLAIRVMGSFLCTREAFEWKQVLDRLKKSPDNKIMGVLQISVDGLQYEEKEIFLHIACFFKGEREDYVKRILDCCGLYSQIGIKRLIEKSLITIRDQEILIHDMLQELGKKMVRDQSPEEPGSRSRIWLHKDFFHVLTTETGTEHVKAIVLDKKEDISECSVDGLSKMKKLTLLILYHNNFSGSLHYLSDRLKYLLWHDYPFASLPPYFTASNLVELNMPNSRIKRLWEGRKSCPYLKRIDLSNSIFLTETPDFSGIVNLERLDLSGCTNLLQVHSSMGFLKNLAFLNLRYCCSLVMITFHCVTDMRSLKVLHLSGCNKLESTPDFTRTPNLEYLDMDECTSLSSIHESIRVLSNLTFFSLRGCTELDSIPAEINSLASLQTLDLCGCSKLNPKLDPNLNSRELWIRRGAARDLPLSSDLKSLIFLDLGSCNLYALPGAIGELRCLERLNLQGNNLTSIPGSIRKLHCLAYLNLSHSSLLRALPHLPMGGATSGGKYFKTVSGSRDHRSGLYLFYCPMKVHTSFKPGIWSLELVWFFRLIQEPYHFRCGFDIVIPWGLKIPRWFSDTFEGDSIKRIVKFNVTEDWFGFAFCVIFELNNDPGVASSSSQSHPFYLSFESEYTEEYFDMPLSLNVNQTNESKKHIWIIYISREHCHFVKTGAHITFKAEPCVKIYAWGMRSIFRQDVPAFEMMKLGNPFPLQTDVHRPYFGSVEKSNTNSGPKFQLPYNWLLSEEDKDEKVSVEVKENNLSHAGL
ncbi:unnamed protein product [Sphenostylis stenocarpa]|uniref:TIR domain-containing protein n=1 Tax=Sphenostylis stenocarpa TaxID=92480 RepID=A0AA86SJ71_9FABA|nr:unnamed protein product [Sphenostylis stenocarpa]